MYQDTCVTHKHSVKTEPIMDYCYYKSVNYNFLKAKIFTVHKTDKTDIISAALFQIT